MAAEETAFEVELALVAVEDVLIKLEDTAEQETEFVETEVSVAEVAAVAYIFSTPQVQSTERFIKKLKDRLKPKGM